jgi:DNA polymerase I-like protein with 3'-5' exonuclease and polymerase domains
MARDTKKASKGGPLQLGFFRPESSWKSPSMSDLPSWKGVKRITIDAECKDLAIAEKLGTGALRDDCYSVGWAFRIDEGPKFYLPMRHEGGGNLPEANVLGYLRSQIKDFEGEYVGANLAYDMDYGYTDGFEWNRNAKFRDIQIAEPIIDELQFSYSLANIGKKYGIEAKDEEMLKAAAESYGVDPKGGLWRLPAKFVGPYAEGDVVSPLEILKKQEAIIDSENLRQIWDLETRTLPVLVRMRRRGVKIDFDKLTEIEKWTVSEEDECYRLIKHMTGVKITPADIWKADALAPALTDIGVRFERTAAGKASIDRFLLGKNDHPVCQAILKARKVNKIRTTFAASVRKYEINGRLHCSFKQIAQEDEQGNQKGVRYGRLSAVHPNMQQQPSPDRDPIIAGEWRKIFIPEPGAIWGCNDYSQQEPRWTTHFAALMDLPRAREAARRYQDDPTTDNHEMMTRLIHGDTLVNRWMSEKTTNYKVNRGHSKNIFLGLCYGEGGAKLCLDIGMPTRWKVEYWHQRKKIIEFFETKREAMAYRTQIGKGFFKEVAGEQGQAILDNFDETVPYVGKLAKKASEMAESRGWVRTVLGRRLNFKVREDGSYENNHKALNRVIQGSSADQVKLAICELDDAGHYIQLQVHDETDGSFASIAKAKEAGDIMRDCILKYCKTWVPFQVDTECGPNWGDIKKC